MPSAFLRTYAQHVTYGAVLLSSPSLLLATRMSQNASDSSSTMGMGYSCDAGKIAEFLQLGEDQCIWNLTVLLCALALPTLCGLTAGLTQLASGERSARVQPIVVTAWCLATCVAAGLSWAAPVAVSVLEVLELPFWLLYSVVWSTYVIVTHSAPLACVLTGAALVFMHVSPTGEDSTRADTACPKVPAPEQQTQEASTIPDSARGSPAWPLISSGESSPWAPATARGQRLTPPHGLPLLWAPSPPSSSRSARGALTARAMPPFWLPSPLSSSRTAHGSRTARPSPISQAAFPSARMHHGACLFPASGRSSYRFVRSRARSSSEPARKRAPQVAHTLMPMMQRRAAETGEDSALSAALEAALGHAPTHLNMLELTDAVAELAMQSHSQAIEDVLLELISEGSLDGDAVCSEPRALASARRTCSSLSAHTPRHFRVADLLVPGTRPTAQPMESPSSTLHTYQTPAPWTADKAAAAHATTCAPSQLSTVCSAVEATVPPAQVQAATAQAVDCVHPTASPCEAAHAEASDAGPASPATATHHEAPAAPTTGDTWTQASKDAPTAQEERTVAGMQQSGMGSTAVDGEVDPAPQADEDSSDMYLPLPVCLDTDAPSSSSNAAGAVGSSLRASQEVALGKPGSAPKDASKFVEASGLQESKNPKRKLSASEQDRCLILRPNTLPGRPTTPVAPGCVLPNVLLADDQGTCYAGPEAEGPVTEGVWHSSQTPELALGAPVPRGCTSGCEGGGGHRALLLWGSARRGGNHSQAAGVAGGSVGRWRSVQSWLLPCLAPAKQPPTPRGAGSSSRSLSEDARVQSVAKESTQSAVGKPYRHGIHKPAPSDSKFDRESTDAGRSTTGQTPQGSRRSSMDTPWAAPSSALLQLPFSRSIGTSEVTDSDTGSHALGSPLNTLADIPLPVSVTPRLDASPLSVGMDELMHCFDNGVDPRDSHNQAACSKPIPACTSTRAGIPMPTSIDPSPLQRATSAPTGEIDRQLARLSRAAKPASHAAGGVWCCFGSRWSMNDRPKRMSEPGPDPTPARTLSADAGTRPSARPLLACSALENPGDTTYRSGADSDIDSMLDELRGEDDSSDDSGRSLNANACTSVKLGSLQPKQLNLYPHLCAASITDSTPLELRSDQTSSALHSIGGSSGKWEDGSTLHALALESMSESVDHDVTGDTDFSEFTSDEGDGFLPLHIPRVSRMETSLSTILESAREAQSTSRRTASARSCGSPVDTTERSQGGMPLSDGQSSDRTSGHAVVGSHNHQCETSISAPVPTPAGSDAAHAAHEASDRKMSLSSSRGSVGALAGIPEDISADARPAAAPEMEPVAEGLEAQLNDPGKGMGSAQHNSEDAADGSSAYIPKPIDDSGVDETHGDCGNSGPHTTQESLVSLADSVSLPPRDAELYFDSSSVSPAAGTAREAIDWDTDDEATLELWMEPPFEAAAAAEGVMDVVPGEQDAIMQYLQETTCTTQTQVPSANKLHPSRAQGNGVHGMGASDEHDSYATSSDEDDEFYDDEDDDDLLFGMPMPPQVLHEVPLLDIPKRRH